MYYWDVAKSIFDEFSIVKQHLDSYNDFVNKRIYEAIEEINESEERSSDRRTLHFHKIRLEKPIVVEADGSRRKIMPIEARIRNRGYTSSIYADLSVMEGENELDRAEVYIGELPVMIKSDLCHLKGMSREELIANKEDPDDPGGYFIINGSEKVLISIEDFAPNRVLVSKEMKGGKEIVVGSIFSIRKGFRSKLSLERKQDGTTYISFPSSPPNLNLFIVLKALGFDSKTKLLNVCSEKPEVVNDILLNLESVEAKNSEEALDYIGKRVAAGQSEEYRKGRASYVLDNFLLPHIGVTADDRKKKAYFLIRMFERIIEVATGKRSKDDKDHYANKRIKISGMLIDEIFRYAMGHFIKDVKYQTERAATRGRKMQIRTVVRPDAMSDKINFAMGTGLWVGKRAGVSQLLDRISYVATLSHLRRVKSPLSKGQQHFEARDLHPTQIGKICTHETPEGQRCGLIKNLAIGCFISISKQEDITRELEKLGVEFIKH